MCSRRGRRPYFAGRFVSPALPQWQGHPRSRETAHNRKCIFNASLIPNIPENPRNRKYAKRGRKRLFNAAIHALRIHVERTFAWEDKFKRLLLRFERIQQRHYGMKLIRKSP
jgi:transposase